MKKEITHYLEELSGNDIETLGNIISNQYKKFLSFYRAVSEYSSDMESIEYIFECNEELNVNIIFKTAKKSEKCLQDILSYLDDNDCEGMAETEGTRCNIKLVLVE